MFFLFVFLGMSCPTQIVGLGPVGNKMIYYQPQDLKIQRTTRLALLVVFETTSFI